MEVIKSDNRITISGIEEFSLEQTLNCGQTFRWKRKGEGYSGVALGLKVYAEKGENSLMLVGVDEEAAPGFIRYFDLERDYTAIKAGYAHDKFLREGMEYAGGIRILNQPPFETLISFIISQNNNVKRISGIIEKLCRKYGRQIGEDAYDFPSAEALAACECGEFAQCGAGYRAPYISETARIIANGFELDALPGLPYLEARQKLQELPGVGPKVADCIALFSLGFTQAFPADVWIRRVLHSIYGFNGGDKKLLQFVNEKFGEYGGIAQQYLFHYARNNRKIFEDNKASEQS